MTDTLVSEAWSSAFGLAPVPLFSEQHVGEGTHTVLLDGGFGSFALSATSDELWRDPQSYEWAWSSGLPHHVTVTETDVAVVRWDTAEPAQFSRRRVEEKLDAFYGYLTNDRVTSTRRVVDHLVNGFRRIRSLVDQTGLGDEQSVEAFLYALELGMQRSGRAVAVGADRQGFSQLLPEGPLELIVGDMMRGPDSAVPLRLHPDLAIRHAGSEIFQEAHFSLASVSTADLFDWIGPASAKRESRGSAHFTPPALARTVVEQALDAISDLGTRKTLTIFDPACGSGSFLYEAVRTLRRCGYTGKLSIVGRDISAAAVSMARFTLALATSDWRSNSHIEIDLSQADFLSEAPIGADVILMNPPFLSWSAMSPADRERVRDMLGPAFKGRADLSMVFVKRAMACLRQGGAMGVLVPSSLLNLLAAEKWRDEIAQEADLRLVASLGDYGLFRHAMVQVSALVLSRKEGAANRPASTLAILASNAADATGDALRAIRKGVRSAGAGAVTSKRGDAGWRAFEVPASVLSRAPTWRLVSPEAQSALERLSVIGATRPLREIFEVNQGVRTGRNSAFVVSAEFYSKLSKSEQSLFRPAAMGDNLVEGRLSRSEYLFYPYDRSGLTIRSEEELRRLAPKYYREVLSNEKQELEKRSDIRRSGREDWWGLSQRRDWGTSNAPRIVSKYFGKEGSFALDETAEYVVVQGFAWFPKWADQWSNGETEEFDEQSNAIETAPSPVSTPDLLAAYSAVFNSEPFQRILQIFSPYVGGGQADLSPRFVGVVPLPDLAALASDDLSGRLVARLVSLGRNVRSEENEWRQSASRAVTQLYGSEIFERI